uniref:Uncharacterized protein n=1 Tax=viral metagenome TaxID=1070528 RepID=A0A6C0HKX0_9ZZZZ
MSFGLFLFFVKYAFTILAKHFIKLTAIFMDIYELVRMFRKTDNSNNIIVYAGNAHINNYHKFLQKIQKVIMIILYLIHNV